MWGNVWVDVVQLNTQEGLQVSVMELLLEKTSVSLDSPQRSEEEQNGNP